MNAASILNKVVKAFDTVGLEAVIIGNAAAAINGAPVTTLDIDFYILNLKKSEKKIKKIAMLLNASFVPAKNDLTTICHIENEEEGLFLDFNDNPTGMGSFASVRSRSLQFESEGTRVYVASLTDIIASKKKANRLKDQAVLPILEMTLEETRKQERQRRQTGRGRGT